MKEGVLFVLGLDDERWEQAQPANFWGATAVVFVAFLALSLVRFGGLVAESPRGFIRMVLLGVHGWLGLAVLVWLGALLFGAERSPDGLMNTLVGAAMAHRPIMAMAVVALAFGGFGDVQGPGMWVTVFALSLIHI